MNEDFAKEILLAPDLSSKNFNLSSCENNYVEINGKLGKGKKLYLYDLTHIRVRVKDKIGVYKVCWLFDK